MTPPHPTAGVPSNPSFSQPASQPQPPGLAVSVLTPNSLVHRRGPEQAGAASKVAEESRAKTKYHADRLQNRSSGTTSWARREAEAPDLGGCLYRHVLAGWRGPGRNGSSASPKETLALDPLPRPPARVWTQAREIGMELEVSNRKHIIALVY